MCYLTNLDHDGLEPPSKMLSTCIPNPTYIYIIHSNFTIY